MPSRRDQLHSAQFSTQRVVAALITHDPDQTQSPFRGVSAAAAVGLVVSLLIVGGAALYAMLTGDAGKSWRDESVVFIEKETGANYVYLGQDQKLHPVLNYASALLIVPGSTPKKPVIMSRDSLSSAPLGQPLGIADAPTSLPARGDLLTKPWTLCSQRNSTEPAGSSSLLVVGDTSGGHALTSAEAAATPSALLVVTPDRQQYLIYNNHWFRIPQPQLALAALGLSGQSPIPVATALVNALPAGIDVSAPALPAQPPSPEMRNAKIGQVYIAATAGGTRAYAVALADGVVEISEVQANLLAADPKSAPAGGQRPVEISIAEFGTLPRSAVKALIGRGGSQALPETAPKLATAGQSVCVSVRNPAEQAIQVLIDAAVSDKNVTDTPRSTKSGTVLADRIAIPRGHGVVVETAAGPTAPSGSGALSLVTDAGIRYPIASRELLPKLGYADVTPVRIPATLVAMLPTGPALDPADARRRA